jgi:2,3-bisphosphoglycerate-independent phosphoglycerate mutase
MKMAIVVGDGMADWPLEELGGRTPLDVASTPWMDRIAREGFLGLVRTIPDGLPPGSDVANMVILGYDPVTQYTGRGPLEAASMGVQLSLGDVAFRCNLVHISLDEDPPRMVDFTSGHIPTEMAREVMRILDREMSDKEVKFYPGVSYRHLMVWKRGEHRMTTTPPHDITGREICSHLPKGKGSKKIRELMAKSQRVLATQEVRELLGPSFKNPPNSIWLWGQGPRPRLEPVATKLGVRGAMITAVDLLKGLATYAGLRILDVPGATGDLNTDYAAKGRFAIEALKEGDDLVFVHVEAPDEASHQGSIHEKIKAIERFDEEVVGQILQGLTRWEDWAILVLPDHATPIPIKTHSSEPVPFAVAGSKVERGKGERFHEEEARRAGSGTVDGRELLERLVKGRWQ